MIYPPHFRCPLDGEIMGQFEYSADRSEATVAFPAHKFPYTASVYYQCNVQLCALADPACQQVRHTYIVVQLQVPIVPHLGRANAK